MISRGRAFAIGALLGAALAAAAGVRDVAGQTSANAEEPPAARLTTDTMDYCIQLADLLGRMTSSSATQPPPEVGSLSLEGERMCDEGQVRGGILRLRQAVAIMRKYSERR